MSFEIITPFKATVFGIETNSQVAFDSVSYLHDAILGKPGVFDEQKIDIGSLVGDLLIGFENIHMKTDYSQSELETELYHCINLADSFDGLNFQVFGSDHCFKHINEKIKSGVYLLNA